MKVMIAVTHLLGTGHLARALTLGRAFAARGHVVQIASGGLPAPQLDHAGITLHQLPPLRSDGVNFTALLDATGAAATPAYLAARQQALCAALTGLAPDILITELFPFGRRVLSAEFIALLDTAQALPRPPVLLSSIRDILAPPSKPERAQRTEEIVTRRYDAVLVHSDPQAAPLERSWPVSERLAPLLRYTGYVAPPAPVPHPGRVGADEILVSAGGGSVGRALFETAAAAARQRPETRWRILVGGQDAATTIQSLPRGDNTVIEPARPDFRQMLPRAAASVSMCGYNTALDLVQAGTPAVFVPFDAGGEVEQGLRAGALSALPGIRVLPAAELTPEALNNALAAVLADPPRPTGGLKFDGAAQSVAIACAMAQARA